MEHFKFDPGMRLIVFTEIPLSGFRGIFHGKQTNSRKTKTVKKSTRQNTEKSQNISGFWQIPINSQNTFKLFFI